MAPLLAPLRRDFTIPAAILFPQQRTFINVVINPCWTSGVATTAPNHWGHLLEISSLVRRSADKTWAGITHLTKGTWQLGDHPWAT